MLKSNNVLGLGCTRVENLGAATNLKSWILLEHHLVRWQVPLSGEGETSVTFLNTA
jgi:hypothetical protein